MTNRLNFFKTTVLAVSFTAFFGGIAAPGILAKETAGAVLTVETRTADEAALARLEAFAAGVRAAEGRFTQMTVDREGRPAGDASSGFFAFSRPGRFLWVYEEPYRQTIVSNGKTLWFYDEDLMQVSVKQLNAALPATPAAILFGEQDFRKDWRVLSLGKVEQGEALRAVPADRSAFEAVELVFGKDRYPVRVILTDSFLNRTTISFSDVRDVEIPAERFEFKPPEGVDVLNESTFR